MNNIHIVSDIGTLSGTRYLGFVFEYSEKKMSEGIFYGCSIFFLNKVFVLGFCKHE